MSYFYHYPPPTDLTWIGDHRPTGQPLFIDRDGDVVYEIEDYGRRQDERSRQCRAATLRDRKNRRKSHRLARAYPEAFSQIGPLLSFLSPDQIEALKRAAERAKSGRMSVSKVINSW